MHATDITVVEEDGQEVVMVAAKEWAKLPLPLPLQWMATVEPIVEEK